MALLRGIGLLALAAIVLLVGRSLGAIAPDWMLLGAPTFAVAWLLLGFLGLWQLLVGVLALLGVGKRP